MPSARSATAAPRRHDRPSRSARPAPARRPRVISRPPRLRLRWERLGRIGLLVMLVVVLGLYVQHALSYVSTRSQSEQQQAIVRSLTRQKAQLTREQNALSDRSTIVQDARTLGMVWPNEQPYVMLGSQGR